MKGSVSLAISTLIASTHGWTFSTGAAAGFVFSSQQQNMVLETSSRQPNETSSVPVQFGSSNVTVGVNITDTALPGVDSQVTDPRAIVVTYDLAWAGGRSLNETIGSMSRVCFSTPASPLSQTAANKDSGNGDCTSALGSDCVQALKDSNPDCSTPPLIPDQCSSAFQDSGTTGSFTLPQNISDPATIYAEAGQIVAASDSEAQLHKAEGLRFVLLQAGDAVSPVCIRVASAGASISGAMKMWAVVTVVIAGVLNLA
ncbi:hypothetical protein Slin15195_G036510 [Septoria linicola]|uniref:Uncharacterized protein n=1 Tax=Septoria linicola TaxID=215465 RepID=A0A9Q9AJ81_9PEZI|nr:hypothetical protein Slin15195_G036510 [Septoria linicola]